jgi:hypothetical protein
MLGAEGGSGAVVAAVVSRIFFVVGLVLERIGSMQYVL